MKKSGKAPYVPPEDLELVLANQKGLNSLRNKAILLVSHYAGLRAKELAMLRVGDVYDIQKGKVREVVRLLGVMTKGNRYREIFLVEERTREHLTRYIHKERPMNADAPLFLSQKGGAFTPNTMQKMLAVCYKKSSIRASSHSGRRAFATHLIRNGADIYSVKEMMGHSSIATTQEYFASDPNRLLALAKRLSPEKE